MLTDYIKTVLFVKFVYEKKRIQYQMGSFLKVIMVLLELIKIEIHPAMSWLVLARGKRTLIFFLKMILMNVVIEFTVETRDHLI